MCVFILDLTITFFNLKYSKIFTHLLKALLLSVMYFLYVIQFTFRLFNDFKISDILLIYENPVWRGSFEKSLVKKHISTIIHLFQKLPKNNGTQECVTKALKKNIISELWNNR